MATPKNSTEQNISRREIVSHMIGAVNAAPLETDPFPYLYITNLFPEPVYKLALATWPKIDAYKHSNNRYRWELHASRFEEQLSPESAAFWRKIQICLEDANLAIRKRLYQHLDNKFEMLLGPDWAQTVGEIEYRNFELQMAVYKGLYRLPPHVDHIRIITNAFVYFSELDRVEPDLGTNLYRSKGLALPTNWDLDEALLKPFLEQAAVAPYQPNSCFAYINGPRSFHGVDAGNMGNRQRRLLMFGSVMLTRQANRIFGEIPSQFQP